MTVTPFAVPTAPGRAGDRPADDAPLPVLGRDVRVPLVGGGQAEYAALDYAASAPALRRVWDEVAAYAPYYGSVHRGAGRLSRLSTELFERSRAEVAAFLGCRPDDQLVFTRSTTDSLNLLASALPPGTRVHVFETEHHAALLPWRTRTDCTVVPLAAPRSPAAAIDTLRRSLAAADGTGPALVCVTGASNVTGELWPVRELARVAHEGGARLVLDAAQLAPHHPVDLTGWEVDYAAFSGHKLYAPFGAGVLAGRPDWLDAAHPYLSGGGASATVGSPEPGSGSGGTDGEAIAVTWHTGPARHEAGSPNVIGAYAVAAACRALTDAGFPALVAREQRLLRRLLAGLDALDGVRVLSLFGPGAERVGVVSFTADGWPADRLAAELSDHYGIGVRDGLFCAHPLVRLLLGADGDPARRAAGEPRAAAVRVSFGAGTPDEHIERFLTALGELLRRGPRD